MATWTTGMFVWRELMTTDLEASLRFFSELVGWRAVRKVMPNGDYYLLSVGEKQVAGMMKMPEGAELSSYWISYVSVEDVDATMAKAKSLGGELVWGPIDVEGVGRMGTIVDPRGCPFSVIRAYAGDPPATVAPEQGEFCWEELRTSEPVVAKAFYEDVLGWKAFPTKSSKRELLGFGELPGEQAASLQVVVAGQRTGWNTFIAVDSVRASYERALELGGKVLSDRVEIPGLGTSAVIADPTGAVVCLFRG